MNKRVFFGILLLIQTAKLIAQREAYVHGVASLEIGDGDNISLANAKNRCIELAKINAIKSEFKETLASDVVINTVVIDGKTSNHMLDIESTSLHGEFLGYDEQHPQPYITVTYENDKLVFTAEVWGIAREIVRAKPDISWSILCGNNYRPDTKFNNGDYLHVRFKSPVAGYVALYMMDSDGNTYCLMPDKHSKEEATYVSANEEYLFLEKRENGTPYRLKLTTQTDLSSCRIVLIFSPHKFSRCIESRNIGITKVNTIPNRDFSLWLLRAKRADKDMVSLEQNITIIKDSKKQNKND